ncbi:hypothetical protein RhiirA5_426653 [Rhizophagus irregularis]|uniref:Uncharacterized protein n=1 Tax=Rhizophagus irregularis TaxID=588596 RepID=A0A2N0P3V0_9GLOM|nr:hypothetical protein RhiirA5_426653 [Rhizophagus irregularis]
MDELDEGKNLEKGKGEENDEENKGKEDSSSSKKGKDKWVRYIPNITHNTPLPGHERSKPSRRRSEDHVDLRDVKRKLLAEEKKIIFFSCILLHP